MLISRSKWLSLTSSGGGGRCNGEHSAARNMIDKPERSRRLQSEIMASECQPRHSPAGRWPTRMMGKHATHLIEYYHQNEEAEMQQPVRDEISYSHARDKSDANLLTPSRNFTTHKIRTTNQIDLHIDRLQRSGAGGYKCIFDKREQTVATQTALGLNCPLPQTGNRPKIQPGKGEQQIFLLSTDQTLNPFSYLAYGISNNFFVFILPRRGIARRSGPRPCCG